MNLRLISFLSLSAIAGLLLTSCGKKEYKPMPFSELGHEKYDNEDIELEGIVKVVTYQYGGGGESFWLAGEGKEGATVYLTAGTEKNQMRRMPNEYTAEDLEITDMNGEKIHVLDRIKVRGEVNDGDGYIQLEADEIEKVK